MAAFDLHDFMEVNINEDDRIYNSQVCILDFQMLDILCRLIVMIHLHGAARK